MRRKLKEDNADQRKLEKNECGSEEGWQKLEQNCADALFEGLGLLPYCIAGGKKEGQINFNLNQ